MEYYEDRFQQEQDALCEYAQFYTLDIDGFEYAQGGYEECEEERERLLKLHAKDGLCRSNCKITHHSVKI